MAAKERWAIRATNPETSEQWSVHDSKTACERELAKKLKEWGCEEDAANVEWARLA